MTAQSPAADPAQTVKVRVWDLPTRLFHWTLFVLVLVGWFTGEEEGVAAQIHRYSGETLAGLLVFRLIWGFVGGEHARFRDFVASPARAVAHVRDLFARRGGHSLGHNPLGGLAVLALLAAVAVLVVTGLFSAGEAGQGGPFAHRFGLELSEVHEAAFRVLQVLVVAHLAGVVLTSWLGREKLVAAMVTGTKPRPVGDGVVDARSATPVAFIVAAALGVATAAVLISLPHPVGKGAEASGAHGQEASVQSAVSGEGREDD